MPVSANSASYGWALAPWIGLAALALVLMALVAVGRRVPGAGAITFAGLAAVFAALFPAAASAPMNAGILLRVDRFALFFLGLALAAAAAVVLLSGRYVRRVGGRSEEYYILLVLATLGAGVLVAATHFVSFLLGLELLSVALYALISYPRTRLVAIEAALKYLVLAAVSSAFLLLGMAFVYARTGTLAFEGLARLAGASALPGSERAFDAAAFAGTALILVGIGFKLGIVPFHMWTADVYQGAPAPVTGFISSVSKGAVVALLVRLGGAIQLGPEDPIWQALAGSAGLSIIAGTLLALHQANLKRLLAYSSIAHLGFALVAFLAGGQAGIEAVSFYLVAYVTTILAAFGVITALSDRRACDREAIDDYRGLGRTHPFLAAVLAFALLSLAGIPLTAGFIGKFLVFTSGIGATMWLLVFLVAAFSGIGIYYYLRVVVALYLRAPAPAVAAPRPSLEESGEAGGAAGASGPRTAPGERVRAPGPAVFPPAAAALAALTVLLVLFGLAPQLVLRLLALP